MLPTTLAMRTGLTVFTFPQAQERARAWFAAKARELAGHAEPQDRTVHGRNCGRRIFGGA